MVFQCSTVKLHILKDNFNIKSMFTCQEKERNTAKLFKISHNLRRKSENSNKTATFLLIIVYCSFNSLRIMKNLM